MRVKKIFGSILAGVLIVSGVSMSANAADIAPKNFEHRDRVIELSLECINRSESSICTDFQLHFHGLKPHQE